MANSACVRLKCPNVYATNIAYGCTKDTQAPGPPLALSDPTDPKQGRATARGVAV